LVAKNHLAFANHDLIEVFQERLAKERDIRALDDNSLGCTVIDAIEPDVVEIDVLAADVARSAFSQELILVGIELETDLARVFFREGDFARPRVHQETHVMPIHAGSRVEMIVGTTIERHFDRGR